MPFNPEIRRNFWLEFSIYRLLAMPIVLGIVFLGAYNANEHAYENMTICSMFAYFLIVKLWGGYKASGAVIDEVNDHTWDFQKLSALSPWSLAIGKLFGSTLYIWYGGAIIFAVFLIAADHILVTRDAILYAVLLLTSALIVHAGALLSSLSAVQSMPAGRAKLRSIFHLLFGVVAGGIFTTHGDFSHTLSNYSTHNTYPTYFFESVKWYGEYYNQNSFLVVMGLSLLAWFVLGIYWQMRGQMRMGTNPWPWFGFVGFWACVLSGLEGPQLPFLKILEQGKAFPSSAYAIIVTFFGLYFILFQEPWTIVTYRRLVAAWWDERYLKFINLCPRWIVTYPLCIIAAVVAGVQTGNPQAWWLLASMFLLVTRDIAMLHFFKLLPASRRPRGTTQFYMVVLYGLIPFLLLAAQHQEIAAAFIPIPDNLTTTAISAAVQALVVIVLAAERWRRNSRHKT